MRRIERVAVQRIGDCVWLEIVANAYLHHMVRNIVGTLLEVQGEADPSGAMARILRAASGAWRAPPRRPSGLYLWRVEYPAAYGIPAPARPGLLD